MEDGVNFERTDGRSKGVPPVLAGAFVAVTWFVDGLLVGPLLVGVFVGDLLVEGTFDVVALFTVVVVTPSVTCVFVEAPLFALVLNEEPVFAGAFVDEVPLAAGVFVEFPIFVDISVEVCLLAFVFIPVFTLFLSCVVTPFITGASVLIPKTDACEVNPFSTGP